MKRVVVRGGSVKDNGLLSSKGISIEENSNNGMKDILFLFGCPEIVGLIFVIP